MSCTNEEECRREKILKDQALIEAAAQDASRAASGRMGMEEARSLIALDQEWLEKRGEIVERSQS